MSSAETAIANVQIRAATTVFALRPIANANGARVGPALPISRPGPRILAIVWALQVATPAPVCSTMALHAPTMRSAAVESVSAQMPTAPRESALPRVVSVAGVLAVAVAAI